MESGGSRVGGGERKSTVVLGCFDPVQVGGLSRPGATDDAKIDLLS